MQCILSLGSISKNNRVASLLNFVARIKKCEELYEHTTPRISKVRSRNSAGTAAIGKA